MKYKHSHLFFSVLFLFTSTFMFGQNEITVNLNWKKESAKIFLSEDNSMEMPNLENGSITENGFVMIHRLDRPSSAVNWKLDMLSYQTSSVDEMTLNFIDQFFIEVDEELSIEVENNRAGGQAVTMVVIHPFIKVNGQIRKVESVVFKRTNEAVYTTKAGNYASTSVLRNGSGDWYKVSVTKDGVHKIDYNFLKDMGLDVDNLNPNHINIYGNGFGRLPELNSEYRPDDLLKNDIFIQGDADGSFDANDYILFYAKGPHKWELKNQQFNLNRNIYSNVSTYFININSENSAARIQNAVTTTSPANELVTDYDSYARYEKELVNLMRTGQRWYGEQFDANLNQSFTFNIPNLNTSKDVIIKGFFASKSGGINDYYNVKYNNTLLKKVVMSGSHNESYSRTGFNLAPGVFTPASGNFRIDVQFNRSVPVNVGYLDYLEVNARSFLKYFNGLSFRDLQSVGSGNISTFQITSFPSNGRVWEVSATTQPKEVQGNLNNGTFEFTVATDSLREFVTFSGSDFRTPTYIKRVQHQDLHALGPADYLIVTHPSFTAQAKRLAALHEGNGVSTHVVEAEKIYNEFSGGTQDPTAIRTFAKMFYDRANGDTSKEPKYLLLFGDGTYDPLDRISNNNYMLPVYETINSEDHVVSLVSDDYFGLLDDNESFGVTSNIDIAVGRFVATTPSHARTLVNKVELYMKNGSDKYASSGVLCGDDGSISTHGDWRLKYTVIADDEQSGYFVTKDFEPAVNHVESAHPEMNVKKIYSDAYVQVTTAGGERYPEVNKEINRSVESGSILTCFVGHGGVEGAAQERIMTIGDVEQYENIDKLTLFVSATCEFSRIDDMGFVSIGELMALNDVGGAIALMTTSRKVYVNTNSITNAAFFKNVFLRDANQEPRTFGEIIMDTKNGPGGGADKRSFMLLGDPALKIALPFEKVVLDSINEFDVNVTQDTLKALSKVRMKGHLEDQFGNVLTGFNGVIQPSVYDKPANRQTLGQDAASPVIQFQTQDNVLFKGKATVKNGVFDYEFIVPKDIDYSYGNGKASFYSWSESDVNAGGYSKEFIIGGIDTTGLNDDLGPEIELFLNDDSFVNGGITNETPILIANLYDESGINTVGNGIGHDITLIVDKNTSNAKVLNSFYESDLDTYQSGSLKFQMDELEPGLHTLTFKAWDVNNNSSEKTLEFTVQEEKEIGLDHVLNYPNPFTTHTEFFFEHNQVCAALETQIEIFTVTGRLVKTINQLVETRGFRTEGIPWDGRDEYGDQLAKGVYVYRVSIKNPDGEETQEMQKLYLIK